MLKFIGDESGAAPANERHDGVLTKCDHPMQG